MTRRGVKTFLIETAGNIAGRTITILILKQFSFPLVSTQLLPCSSSRGSRRRRLARVLKLFEKVLLVVSGDCRRRRRRRRRLRKTRRVAR